MLRSMTHEVSRSGPSGHERSAVTRSASPLDVANYRSPLALTGPLGCSIA